MTQRVTAWEESIGFAGIQPDVVIFTEGLYPLTYDSISTRHSLASPSRILAHETPRPLDETESQQALLRVRS